MRFMGLDLNLLVIFQAMMDHRSVTYTSRQLNLTQPAVSNALQRLRHYFKDDLFVMSGSRMVPTALSERLAEPIKALLADAGAMLTAARPFEPATSDRTFVVGTSDHVTDTILSGALNAVFAEAPRIRLDIVPLVEDQWSALETGDVDLHVLPYEFAPPDQPTIELYTDRYVVLCDRNNGAVHSGMTHDQLRQFRIIGALMGVPRKMRGGFAPQMTARLIDQASLTVKQFSQLPFMIEDSDRIAIIPYSQAVMFCRRFRLAFFELGSGGPYLRMVAQVNRARENDTGLAWFIDKLVDAASTFRPDKIDDPVVDPAARTASDAD